MYQQLKTKKFILPASSQGDPKYYFYRYDNIKTRVLYSDELKLFYSEQTFIYKRRVSRKCQGSNVKCNMHSCLLIFSNFVLLPNSSVSVIEGPRSTLSIKVFNSAGIFWLKTLLGIPTFGSKVKTLFYFASFHIDGISASSAIASSCAFKEVV